MHAALRPKPGQLAAGGALPRENLPAAEETAKLWSQWAKPTESTRDTRTKPS